ncbi:hypothetical protein Sjap_001770 [Stephania japonica]|uniref:protein-serine/threonine phosphatase n=1 Tax=Stephania japonica TaxID=461633 RepID=A0AAP0KN54_9MAGN
MGNRFGKIGSCFNGGGGATSRGAHDEDFSVVISSEPFDEGLGHSFVYVRPDPRRLSLSKIHSEETTTFRTISGASVSANTATPLSTAFVDLESYSSLDRAAAFESSNSFASLPLQPVPRGNVNGLMMNSGPLIQSYYGPTSTTERGFMSGPIERGFMSGPIERGFMFSGPLESSLDDTNQRFQRSFSHGGVAIWRSSKRQSLIRQFTRAIARRISKSSIVAPIKTQAQAQAQAQAVVSVKESEWGIGSEKNSNDNLMTVSSSTNLSSEASLDDEEGLESNLQWAQGKAGEDRVHVVISEEHGWVFVGIYDGFNGPDAPDYLLSNLYSSVHKELKGLLWEDKFESLVPSSSEMEVSSLPSSVVDSENSGKRGGGDSCSQCVVEPENYPTDSRESKRNRGGKPKDRFKGAARKWEESHKRWKCEWDRERLELDLKLKEQLGGGGNSGSDGVVGAINHSDVLKALSQALRMTEEAYLDIADKMVMVNPELALMGSCVLVMLMKGEDVYVMNVGDSRAVVAQKAEPELWIGKTQQDLERINEETLRDLEAVDGDQSELLPSLTALQLTIDHSTSIEEEVQRIKNEHPDDASAVTNDRVKGSLKVTRAFGAGFLKQPKWNNALLEMFRIDYVGMSPYINCFPSLYHHRLGPKDRFLILSSDGLYQYFTNEEAVSQVEWFIATSPEGDPAQHLVEEVLFRAAKKAGMDFHELLEIPQGDRRRYHDDISIIVISLEGRIWRSCV